MNEFSVELGLLDYVNVILATLFYILVCSKLKGSMKKWLYRTMLTGAVLSIIMAFLIPTIKVLVGLKFFEFETPEYILTLAYIGFFLFGGSLFLSTCKKFKINSNVYAFNIYIIGVFLGGLGRILIYVSVLKMCIQKRQIAPIVILIISLLVQLFQIYEASGGPIPYAWFHWVIEASNITAQALLLLATWLYFREGKLKS